MSTSYNLILERVDDVEDSDPKELWWCSSYKFEGAFFVMCGVTRREFGFYRDTKYVSETDEYDDDPIVVAIPAQNIVDVKVWTYSPKESSDV